MTRKRAKKLKRLRKAQPPQGGTMQFQVHGQTTKPVPYDATALQMAEALNELPGIKAAALHDGTLSIELTGNKCLWYAGEKAGLGTARIMRADGTELAPDASLKLRNHSPTGFEWGYGGSGPAQTALALLLDATGSAGKAMAHYQEFKREHVANWGNTWRIMRKDLVDWVASRERREQEGGGISA